MVLDFLAVHLGIIYDLIGLFFLFIGLIVLGGVLIARFDKIPLEDAIYCAFLISVTIGFDVHFPKTRASRIITILLAILGLILLGILVGIAVQALDIIIKAKQGV